MVFKSAMDVKFLAYFLSSMFECCFQTVKSGRADSCFKVPVRRLHVWTELCWGDRAACLLSDETCRKAVGLPAAFSLEGTQSLAVRRAEEVARYMAVPLS